MPTKRRASPSPPPPSPPAPIAAPTSSTLSTTFSALSSSSTSADMDFTPEILALALDLIEACYAEDLNRVQILVGEYGAHAFVQDGQGWTALHAAAATGNTELCKFLLRKSNAVWNIVDNIGCTAGDLAYSMNHNEAYSFLLDEGIRAEMLKAALQAAASPSSEEEEEDNEVDPMDSSKEVIKLSTASDNNTFLSSKLRFVTDEQGQEIAIDEEGNGVMMGWEREIMRKTAERCCEGFEGRRRGEGLKDEDGDEVEFKFVNVGFGLGIIDTYLQTYKPTSHLIIEPHPDVLAHAKEKGWFEKPGVRFYQGTWKQWLKDQEDGKELYEVFDVVYFDTYSEHYIDLHQFFDLLPNILRSPLSRFSFFHGLGATSRNLYDTYTTVSELHLKEIGLVTEWEEVELENKVGTWEGVERRYWEDIVGEYRLPVCWLEM